MNLEYAKEQLIERYKRVNKNEKKIISKDKDVKISLAEKFENYKWKNLTKEFSWDEDIGKEVI